MAVHERYNSLYISSPSSAKLQREPSSSGERERQRLIFLIYIPNLTLCSIFSFEVILTVRNKLKDFRVSRDS